MPENDDLPDGATTRRGRRLARPGAVAREVVMGLDDLERRLSFAGSGIALVLALVFIPHLLGTTRRSVTLSPVKGVCPSGYHLVAKLCQGVQITHPSDWVLQFVVLLVLGGAIFIFAWRRKRPGTIVAALLLGFLTGTAGLLFLFLGGWLTVRAFRLQKYGDATFRGSNVKARELAQRRRDERATRGPRQRKSSPTPSTTASRTPAASKRYTPKKTNRR